MLNLLNKLVQVLLAIQITLILNLFDDLNSVLYVLSCNGCDHCVRSTRLQFIYR